MCNYCMQVLQRRPTEGKNNCTIILDVATCAILECKNCSTLQELHAERSNVLENIDGQLRIPPRIENNCMKKIAHVTIA